MPTRRLTALDLFMLLFALSAILGVIPAYDSSLSVGALAAILISVAAYFAVAHLPRSRSAVQVIGGLALIASVALALYFITQYAYLGYSEAGFITRIGRLTTLLPDLRGFTPHPNAVATFLGAALPLSIAFALSSRRALWKVTFTAVALVILYAVFLTGSRGAWLALAATGGLAAVLVVLNRLPRRAATLLIGGVIALIGIGLIAVIVLGPERLPLLSSTFSRASDRGRLFLNSLFLGGDYAFTGAGLGDAFALVYSRFGLLIQVPYLTYAHNLPLSVWLNQGLLGVIALAGIVIAFYFFVRRINRAAPPAIFHGAWLGVTATLLHGLTDAPQYADSRWVMPMLFVSIGLAAAASRLASGATDNRSRSVPRPIVIGIPIVIVILIVLFNQPILAAWNTNLGAMDETRAELGPDLTSAQRVEGYASAQARYWDALAIDPDWPNANRRLGNLLAKLDRFEEAVPLLEAAYARETSNPAAIKGLGLAYVWIGRTQNAARLFLLLDDPKSMAQELFTWANFRDEQGRPLSSAYAMETALTMYPEPVNLDVWLLVADTYRRAGQVDAARSWYNRVVEVDPGNKRALKAINEINH